jgi:hypothetical protein
MSISADVQYTLLHRRTVHPWAARLLTRIVDLALRKVEARCDAPDLLTLFRWEPTISIGYVEKHIEEVPTLALGTSRDPGREIFSVSL